MRAAAGEAVMQAVAVQAVALQGTCHFRAVYSVMAENKSLMAPLSFCFILFYLGVTLKALAEII